MENMKDASDWVEENWETIQTALQTCAKLEEHLPALSVDRLAQIIRTVDGDNSLGAGALAEAIIKAIEEQS